MFLAKPGLVLNRIVFSNRALWEVFWRQIRPNSRGIEPQTGQSSSSEEVHDQDSPMSDAKTSSPDRKRARTDDDMGSKQVLKFSKLSEHAFTPARGSKLAAGFDLFSAYDYTIPAGGKILAKTDISIALPDGCYGRVAPRSGLAHKHFIDVGAGVIDQDYRGNVGVVMFNFNKENFTVAKGDRIAQLICERIFLPELEEIQTLDNTERGAGGFGSTGVSLTETNGTKSNDTNGTTTAEDKPATNGDQKTNGTDDKPASNGDHKTNGTDATESKESS
ncbi:deoxyuridine 5'-triphosphate nucleotidohydrolase-like [Amphiura filiformis]|uniref:deoxyuridine 5'-triphosphate nucleotidohydrolase-like n=1 Tax=Amphiura filiformis TaxID=82378 RepID=UPI003B20C299